VNSIKQGGSSLQRAKQWLGLGLDRTYDYLFRLKTLPGSGGIFRYKIHPYRGPSLELSGGILRENDLVAELHLNNALICGVARRGANATLGELGPKFELALACLAQHTRHRGRLQEIRAIYGVTRLAPACHRYGFDVHPLKVTPASRLVSWWQGVVEALYLPAGRRHRKRTSQEIWMSANKLRELYLN